MTVTEDPVENVQVGAIDFNVIAYSPRMDGKISAMGSSDSSLGTSIQRAYVYSINKLDGLARNTGIAKFKKSGIVVDVVGEEGARGPSSGLGYVAGLISLALGKKFKDCSETALTGEVSCNGDVSAVGGIAAKAAAAKASGMKKLYLPAENKDELKYFKSGSRFRLIYIRHADEMLSQIFPDQFIV